jgi:hypothetical protein
MDFGVGFVAIDNPTELPPKILVVEHAELLAVRSLSLNPVLGAVVCYVKHVA